MPSFMDIKEGGKVPFIGLLVSFCLLLIGGVSTVYYEVIYEPPRLTTLLCANPDCGHHETYEQEVFMQMIQQRENQMKGQMDNAENPAAGMPGGMPMDMMMMPWGQPGYPLQCPECGQDTYYSAIVCDDCGKVFFRGVAGDTRYQDKCPDCGYSKHQELEKERKGQ